MLTGSEGIKEIGYQVRVKQEHMLTGSEGIKEIGFQERVKQDLVRE